MQPLLLNSKWSVWENYKSDQAKSRLTYQARKVLAFRTLPELALVWKTTPLSSLANYFLREDRLIPKHEVDPDSFLEVSTLSFFRADIEPKWEDPANHDGGSFNFVFGDGQATLQRVYQALVFGLVNESFPFCPRVVGVRFIDKYLGAGRSLKMKVDLWVDSLGVQQRDQIGGQLVALLAELGVREKVNFKTHEK